MKKTFKFGFLTLSLLSGLSYAKDNQKDLDIALQHTQAELKQLNGHLKLAETEMEHLEDRQERILLIIEQERTFFKEKVDNANDNIKLVKEVNKDSLDRYQKKITTGKSMIDSNAQQLDSIDNYQNTANNVSSSIAHNKEIGMGLKKQFDDFSNDFSAHKQFTDGAIAGAAAMTMLTVPKGIGNTAISAAGSYYNGQSGVALGVTHRISSVTIRTGATYNTGSKEPSISAAIGYDF